MTMKNCHIRLNDDDVEFLKNQQITISQKARALVAKWVQQERQRLEAYT
jgi:hypothetical protein